MISRRISPLLVFGAFAILANLTILFILRSFHNPAVTAASCADLVITVPAVYYLLVVRTGVQPLITIIPVLLSGLLRASYIAPTNGIARIGVAAACELGIVWFLVRRGRSSLFLRVLLSELSIPYYAFRWGLKPDIPPDSRAFTMHRKSGTALIFGMLAGLSLIEAACVHLVVQHWSVTAAWWITGLSIYGAVLLTALARSFTLLPILVTPDSVLIRAGLFWTLTVHRAQIASVEPISPPFPERRTPGYLRITGIGTPNLILETRGKSHCGWPVWTSKDSLTNRDLSRPTRGVRQDRESHD